MSAGRSRLNIKSRPVVLVGALVDRCKSKQTPFTAGLVIMAVATILFFLATNAWIQALARGLQGASAAIVWTAGIAYVNAALDSEQRAMAMGWVSTGSSMGEVTGPVIGGLVYGYGGHSALFTVAMGFVGLDIVLRLFIKRPVHDPAPAVGETQPLLQPVDPSSYCIHETARNEGDDDDDDDNEQASLSPSTNHHGNGSMNNTVSSEHTHLNPTIQSHSDCRGPVLLDLLRRRDLIESLWAMFLAACMRTALEAVSFVPNLHTTDSPRNPQN
jgi:hypothetical protein